MVSFVKSFQGYRKLCQLPPDKRKIVFYSEGKNYWVNFKDTVKCLINNYELTVCYVTSDLNDPRLNEESPKFIPVYIGDEFFRILMFRNLRADLLVTTLPDVGSFHLKRPLGVGKLVYMHHSLSSMNMIYRAHAYDHYDVIMCVGAYHEYETREMEEYFNTHNKLLIKAGYPALDDLLEKLGKHEKTHQVNIKPIVTIAPSWQEDNIIETCADELIDSCLKSGFTVQLRPHPITLKYGHKAIDKILDKFKSNVDFVFDNNSGGFNSYLQTDVMVTDWSGTAYKFAFSTLKPILFINTPIKDHNPHYRDYKNIPVEIKWRDSIGVSLDLCDAKLAGVAIEKLLSSDLSNDIRKIRDENIYNLGNSAAFCAESIIKLLQPS